jgi:hypothetical protein
MRAAVRALARAGNAAEIRQAVTALPAALPAQVPGGTFDPAALGTDAIAKILAGATDASARAFAEQAAVRCGGMAAGRQIGFAEYVRRLGQCLFATAQETVQSGMEDAARGAIRRLRSVAPLGPSLAAAVEAERARLGRESPVFPSTLARALRTADEATARAFAGAALYCAEIPRDPAVRTEELFARMGACLQSALEAARGRAQVAGIRRLVLELAAGAKRGARPAQEALRRVLIQAPAELQDLLIPKDLRARIAAASDSLARAMGERAAECASLPEERGEPTTAYAVRVRTCLARSAHQILRSIEAVVEKTVGELTSLAQRGGGAVREGLDGVVAAIPSWVNPQDLVPEAVRTALRDADRRTLGIFVRGARRCRDLGRTPHQDRAEFARLVGACLANALSEGDPQLVAQAVARSVHHLIASARKGSAALPQGLREAEAMLGGQVPAGDLYGMDLRLSVARATAAWIDRFVPLALPCANRELKKHHNLPEHIVRVALCLSAAARGITGDMIEAEVRTAVRAIAAGAAAGQRGLRIALDREAQRLSKLMRVQDLLPESLYRMLLGFDDVCARAFSLLAAPCAGAPRAAEERISDFVKSMQRCLGDARDRSSEDQLVARVREAVRVLAAEAQQGADRLRRAPDTAAGALRGLVPADAVLTRALRVALAAASDAQASAFASEAHKCADVARGKHRSLEDYLSEVSRCLVASSTRVADQTREEGARAALSELGDLAASGAEELKKGYGGLLAKYRGQIALPEALARGMDFNERTSALAARLRNDCAKLPANTPREVEALVSCVGRAAAAALKIPPPDPCQGKRAGEELLECCLTAQNRTFPSCAAHRYACRPGHTFNTAQGTCVRIVCPPGTGMDSSGACVRLACAPGLTHDALGQCVPSATALPAAPVAPAVPAYPGAPGVPAAPAAPGLSTPCPAGQFLGSAGACEVAQCPPGSSLDALNRCIRAVCPEGSQPTGLFCASPGCPSGQVRNAAGFCQPAACPLDSYLDRWGRCLQMSCPTGLVQQGRRCVRGVVCPPGSVLNVAGQCTAVVCPPGMIPALSGQCLPHVLGP